MTLACDYCILLTFMQRFVTGEFIYISYINS